MPPYSKLFEQVGLANFDAIQFMHLQEYDENYCVYLARIGLMVKKAGGNVITHAQHRIIYFCIIYASR